MAKTTALMMSAMLAVPLLAQAPASATATARVRLVSQAAWQRMAQFSAMSQVRLQGVVEQVEGAEVRLKMPFGTVQVDMGQAGQARVLRAGEALEIVAAKIMVRGSQRLLAREVLPQA
jgi:hypothetical protein